MSPPLLPQDITMTSETEETVLAEALAMTGLKTPAELIDMANVGQSLMERIADLIKQDGPFKGWMPADDPAEIVFDLVNHYEDAALSRAPGDLDLGGSTRMTSPASRSQTPRPTGWQDISTAPKDGQDVLIWNAEGAEIARWYPLEEDGSDQPGHDEGWIGTFAFPGRSWGYRLRSEPQGQPSHWMPLPGPPAEEDPSGAQRSELTRLALDEPVLSPPSTGGEGEDWDRIPRAKRFGRRLNESAVKHLAPGTLLRFYSEDPWFDPSPSSPANGDIVVFTGEVSNTFPKVGPHLEVRTLGGRVYPGGGWVYQIFQFVADPSPEMGEISREEIAKIVDPTAFKQWQSLHDHCVAVGDDAEEARETADWAHKASCDVALEKADQILKLKENGLSREGLGGSAGAGSGAAGPSDCAEGDAPSDLEQTICEALQDSLGPDWSAEVGARYVIDAIRERG